MKTLTRDSSAYTERKKKQIKTRGLQVKKLIACVLFVSFYFSSQASAEKIKEIVVYENSKTTDATVRYLAGIDVGDEFSVKIQDRVRLDLISSGLFKEVSVFKETHPEGGAKVTILAEDKHSWIIAPTFYNQPTNRGAGVGFGENNLFGQNKKLLLYGQVATGDSFFVGAYVDPSIARSIFHWQLDTFLRNERVFEYAAPKGFIDNPERIRETKLRYLNLGTTLGLTLFRRLTVDGRIRGAYVYYSDSTTAGSATPGDVDPSLGPNDSLAKPGAEGWDVSWKGVLKIDSIANYFGISTGTRLQLDYEKSLSALGSDFDYWYGSVSGIRAIKFFKKHNLVMRGFGGIGKDMPFQQEFTSGGTALRGYENRQFRGDFKLSSNIEYSVHLLNIPFPLLEQIGIRGHVFYDTAYVKFLDIEESDTFRNYILPGHDENDGLAPWKNSVGVGIRFFSKAVVLPLLGLDVGYGLESGETQVYFAIGLTDL